jgi:recombination protein RecA
LLQNGGFAAIVVDMGSIVPEHALRVPLATWFRFRAAAEQKRTSVVLLMQHPCAKSSAALTLRLLPGNPLQEQSTVFSGVEHYVEVMRQRFAPSSDAIVLSRKPPQQQKYSRWQSRTVWTGR